MSAPWPSAESRERYIRFLELELKIMKNASLGTVDPELLSEFDSLLEESFPRTMLFITKKLAIDIAGGLTDEIRAVAWAEARAVPDECGQARVVGAWTSGEISEDINDCFRVARQRSGL